MTLKQKLFVKRYLEWGNGIPADNFCRWMLTDFTYLSGSNETVFLTPMRTGKGGLYLDEEKRESQVRLAYVKERADLCRAMDVIRVAISMYTKLILGSKSHKISHN